MVIRFLHDRIVEVIKIEFSLKGYLVVRIQKVEGKNGFGTEHRGWVPTDTQELSKFFEKSALGTTAEADMNSVVTRNIDNKHPLNICENGAGIPRMPEVDDQTEVLKGYPFKKAVRPDLE